MTTGPSTAWNATDLQALLRRFAWPSAPAGQFPGQSPVQSTGQSPDPWRLQPWGTEQGFSSADIWRVQSPAGEPPATPLTAEVVPATWCLRAWPQAFSDTQRLAWIHRQIRRAAAVCPFLLTPLPEIDGAATWTAWHGRLWQVEPWATGQNDYLSHPSPTRLAAVMQALAALHNCWLGSPSRSPDGGLSGSLSGSPAVSLSGSLRHSPDGGSDDVRLGVSPGLNRRLEQWEEVRRHAAQWLATARQRLSQLAGQPPEEIESWRQLLQRIEQVWRQQDRPGQAELAAVANQLLPLGPVLSDVWSDHLFFDEQRLTAIIDYGGLRVDSVAADLSRCLSSLCGQDPQVRDWALQQYDQQRGLTAAERLAVWAYDRSSQVLGPLHWVRWLFVDQRFAVEARILTRLERIVAGQPF